MKRLFEKLRANYYDARMVHPMARIPWSAIRRIGQSRLLALTIIVPFLGSLLLFNQHVVDVLTISPELIKRLFGGTPEQVNDTARYVTLNRLYYVYFGLSFLGIASSLFALFCPLDIKSHGTAREYLQVEGPLVTGARMSLLVPNVAQAFIMWAGSENSDEMDLTRQLAEPDAFVELFCEVATDLYVDEAAEEERWAKENNQPTVHEIRAKEHDEAVKRGDKPDDEPLDFGPHTDFRGYPDPWKIAESLYMRRRLEQGFWHRVNELCSSEKHRADMLTLHYMALDNSKPWLRTLVISLYTIGFGLLLWPTAVTFVRLAISAVR